MDKSIKILILFLVFAACGAIGFFFSPLLPFFESSDFEQSKAKVVTLRGYLHIYPIDLGRFSSEPLQLIKSLNEQKKFGRNDWRVPTQEEVNTFLAYSYMLEGINTNNTYISTSVHSGTLRLVATGETFSTTDFSEVAKERADLIAEQTYPTVKIDNENDYIDSDIERVIEETKKRYILNVDTNDDNISANVEYIEDVEIIQQEAVEEEKVEDDQPFVKVEQMPSFMGGDLITFRDWVQSQLCFPQIAQENNISGRVLLMFVIERDGSLTNIQVLQSPDSSLSDEAVRVLNTSPRWTPGKQLNQPVRVKYTIPIDFRIQH